MTRKKKEVSSVEPEKDDTVVGWNVDNEEGNEEGSLVPIKTDENDSHIIHIEHKERKSFKCVFPIKRY
ncbi:586_t:CDS:2 [Funneliformis caledonium]|uniref:586_t:CDS:1 n=1 Tax=Funneliformis caledonium TaxID=1117310 RepID=A0A9N8VZ79_9GLOM|nr:586_t:CDS:2 [Funneliformis caledonium]